MNTLYQSSNSVVISSLNTHENDNLKEGQWLITHHSFNFILHQHLLNIPIRLSLSHSDTTVPQDTLSHTDITGTRQWNAYNINKMVQVAITLAKMMVSLLLRRLIFWIKLLMTGKRSLNMLRSFTIHWFLYLWIFLRCLTCFLEYIINTCSVTSNLFLHWI